MVFRICRNFGQVLTFVSLVSLPAFANDFSDSWFVGIPDVVSGAPQVQDPPTSNEMINFLNDQKSREQRDEVIDQISFLNEDTVFLDLFRELHHPEGFRTKKREFSVKCHHVICAVQEIYGEREGLQLLYLLSKFGLNATDLTGYLELRRWTAAELDFVIGGFSDFPWDTSIVRSRGLLQHYRKQVSGSFATAFRDPEIHIVVNPAFDRLPDLLKRALIFHEIAHHFGNREDLDLSPEWLKISDWQKKGKKWKMMKITAMVSRYGNSNPVEDFAETMVSYRYDGRRLKEKVPEKFEFMKTHVFDGHEYL